MTSEPKQADFGDVPDAIADCIARCGADTWIVGGAVRDRLLRRDSVADWDLATASRPDALRAAFPAAAKFDSRLGYVSFDLNEFQVTVSTLRVESSYNDARHPDSVEFVDSPERDAWRRDFTVNALYAAGSGAVIDPTGGLEDLAARRLRMVGDAHARLAEDPLRVLRALRFSAVLELEIEPSTREACIDCRDAAAAVSPARRFDEFDRAIRSAGGVVLRQVRALELCCTLGAEFVLRDHTAQRVDAIDRSDDALRWVSVLSDTPTPLDVLRGLAAPRGLQRQVARTFDALRCLRDVRSLGPVARSRVATMPEAARALAALEGFERAEPGSEPGLEQIRALLRGAPTAPLLSGEDAIARGIEPGPLVGQVLAEADARLSLDADRETALSVLDTVIDGHIKPRRDPCR